MKEIYMMHVHLQWKRHWAKQSKDEEVFGRKYLIWSRVPELKVTHDEETNEVSVDVCDDPYQYGALDVSNLPLLITVGQVKDLNMKTKDTKFVI
jgi:hypothetical protein